MCDISSQIRVKNTAWKDPPVQKKPIISTLECQLVTKKNAGHQMSSVTTAATLLMVGLEERSEQCVFLSPVSGVTP